MTITAGRRWFEWTGRPVACRVVCKPKTPTQLNYRHVHVCSSACRCFSAVQFN